MPEKFIDNYLLFQLALASHTFSEEFYDQLRAEGVSPAKWRILINLVDCQGMYLTALAKYSLYEQSRVTKLVDQLVGEGLVEKRSLHQDRRRVGIHITAKGTDMVKPLIEQAKIHEASVLSNLSASDQKHLKSILNKLAKRHAKDMQVSNLKLVETT
ncbi:MAG: MarR family transcriptional regulator [Robiginitomaculum sp.]|nr:MarR family transcriptional regulator [Robiginitomaculum sp.]